MIEGITEEKVIEQVRKLAKENPNFVYMDRRTDDVENWSYLGYSIDEPNVGRGCIVEQALLDLGVTKEELAEIGIENLTSSAVIDKLGIVAERGHSQYLDFVQDRQGTGESWGMAVKNADNVG